MSAVLTIEMQAIDLLISLATECLWDAEDKKSASRFLSQISSQIDNSELIIIFQHVTVMTEISDLLDIDTITEFYNINHQHVTIIEILLLLTFVNDNNRKRLHELNKKKNYESKIFHNNKFCLKFFKILKCSDSDRLDRFYQHILVILVHFVQYFRKDSFESSHSSSLLNWILL